MTCPPFVTVLVPARNEAAHIERCLRSVLAQDHPHDRMEVVVVDGGSTDSTGRLARALLDSSEIEWKVIDNPTGTTPGNLNAGLASATGSILCRVDARSIVPPEYVRTCAEILQCRPDVVVTGGSQVALPPTASARGRGIARALNNRLSMGGSPYRSRAGSGPADTVYLGSFRTQQLREAGGWDEAMHTNQDFELNRRLNRVGTVWFDSGLRVGYVPRSTLLDLWKQYRRFGRWKVRYWRHSGEGPLPRQRVPLVAPAVATAVVAAAVAVRPRTSTLAAAAGGIALGFLAVDAVGVDEPADLPVRMVGAAASAVVALGWSSGVLSEGVRRG